MGDGYLIHYASPYYDPVKAHEYYEEHKKLKGRKTSALNDEGKAASNYVKDRINAEYKEKVQTHKEQTDSNIQSTRDQASSNIKSESESTKASIQQHSERMKSEISSLQAELKRMNRVDKANNRERIANKIASLRDENASKKAELQSMLANRKASIREESKAKVSGYREEHKTAKEQYKQERDQKLAEELDKIYSDSNFAAEKKAKKSGSRKKSNSKVKYGPGSEVNGIKL